MKNNKPLSPSLLFEQDGVALANLFNEDSKPLEQIGHYKILSELGAGGMGKVYKAFDPQMNRTVAIKVVLHPSAKARGRFLAEAKTMAQFRHANIVTVYDIATDASGLDYIVMEFIEGKDLTTAELSPRRTLAIIRDAALALDYAHQQGIIHRDLKPANLILTAKNSKVIVMDFGLAKNVKSVDVTQSGALIGSPRYMAPEQAASKLKDICSQTDVYALGTILYELLAGTPAVKGKTPAQILYNILQNEVKPLKKHKPQLAAELGIICARAIAKKINQRYATAKEFADDIDRFLKGEIIQAQAFPLWYRVLKKLKKYRATVAAIVLSLLAIVSVVYAFKMLALQQKLENHLRKAAKLKQTFNSFENAKKFSSKERSITKTIEMHMRAIEQLQKAQDLAPQNKEVEEKLFLVHRSMGLLALAKKNYLLSYSSFRSCYKLRKTKVLLKLLDAKRLEVVHRYLKRVDVIMKEVTDKEKPGKNLLDARVVEISRMRNPKVVQKLLSYVERGSWWQRLLTYSALGKLGDKTAKVKGKDSVDWLLKRLGQLDPVADKKLGETPKSNKEIEELIWALGWLRDTRAEKLVGKKRWQAGDSSLLWIKTETPYKWIPVLSDCILNSAKAYYSRGLVKSNKSDFNGAIADYTQAITLNSKGTAAYNGRASAYYNLKEYQKAISDYTQAISLNPRYIKAYNNRAIAYHDLKEYQKAIIDYTQAISLNPKYIDAYNGRGNAYLNLKEYQKAIVDYTQAISLNPKHIEAYNGRGSAYHDLKEYQKAIVNYTQAISLHPKYVKAYNNRASAYHDLEEYQEAINDYTQAISISPRHTDAYINRGIVYDDLKMYQKAINDYTQAISFNLKYTKAYVGRGNVYNNLKEYQKAIDNYTQAISIDPKYTDAYINRGVVYYSLKKYQKAIDNYTQAISISPKHTKAYVARGSVYDNLKEYQKAIDNYTQAISIDPKYTSVYISRGTVYYNLKKYQKAINDYTQAIKIAPTNALMYRDRGSIFSQIGKHRQAISDFRHYLKLQPKNPHAPQIHAYIRKHSK